MSVVRVGLLPTISFNMWFWFQFQEWGTWFHLVWTTARCAQATPTIGIFCILFSCAWSTHGQYFAVQRVVKPARSIRLSKLGLSETFQDLCSSVPVSEQMFCDTDVTNRLPRLFVSGSEIRFLLPRCSWWISKA